MSAEEKDKGKEAPEEKAEKKEAAKPEAKAEEKIPQKDEKAAAKETKAKEEPEEKKVKKAPAPTEEKPKRVKVTRMTLEQVEEALANARENMGGYESDYARSLLDRKSVLSGQTPAQSPYKKAA